MTAVVPHSSPESTVVPLTKAAGLPQLSPRAARLSHVACDERFQSWLGSALRSEPARRGAPRQDGPLVMLSMETEQGALTLGIGEDVLPVAARCALGLPDRKLAAEVVSELLQSVFEAFAPVVTRVRVVGVARAEPSPDDVVLEVAAVAVSVRAVDADLFSHVLRLMQGTSARLPDWRHLRIQGRLRLGVRRWPPAFIESLRSGDTVLLANAPLRVRLIAGTGVTMQADAQMRLDEEQVQLEERYEVAPDDLEQAPDAGEASLQELQLPVAFEMDTARISLAELAGMQPGYVVELDVPVAQATVRLVCHGQVVGHGQLVAVGERLGVRIERMGVAHVAAADR